MTIRRSTRPDRRRAALHTEPGRSPLVRRHGLTLIDVSITVLVMGILSAVALPRFAVVLESRRADATARRVAADLEYARRTAMSTSRNCTVQFLNGPDRYAMTGVTHPHKPGQPYAVSFSELSDGVRLASAQFNGTATLTYSVYGLPLVGTAPLTSGQITVASGSQTRTVTISPTTGKAVLP